MSQSVPEFMSHNIAKRIPPTTEDPSRDVNMTSHPADQRINHGSFMNKEPKGFRHCDQRPVAMEDLNSVQFGPGEPNPPKLLPHIGICRLEFFERNMLHGYLVMGVG